MKTEVFQKLSHPFRELFKEIMLYKDEKLERPNPIVEEKTKVGLSFATYAMLASHSVQINSATLRKAREKYDLVWTKTIGSMTFI